MHVETIEMIETETIAPSFPASEVHMKPFELHSTELRFSFLDQRQIAVSILMGLESFDQ